MKNNFLLLAARSPFFFMLFAITFHSSGVWANPYPDPNQVPPDSSYPQPHRLPQLRDAIHLNNQRLLGLEVLRVTVKVSAKEKYSLQTMVREQSGTEAFLRRTRSPSGRGSYRAMLRGGDGKALGYDDIGLGRFYRRLVDGITFRLPFPAAAAAVEIEAENPTTGKMEHVLTIPVDPIKVPSVTGSPEGLEIRELRRPLDTGRAGGAHSTGPELRLNFYADGYLANRKNQFFTDCEKAVATLVDNHFPLADRMHFFAVFAPSPETLGSAHDPGTPDVKEKNTFLGLYFPYWNKIERWYNIVYPTRENKFRDALSLAPYDYSVALVDDGDYWGVGNYRELTAIPARSSMFSYLFLHEFGHYFGLNEEYEGGGRTELEFAPGIDEPWSPNITFLRTPSLAQLKWNSLVKPSLPLPTPSQYWHAKPPVYGAYRGGYGDSDSAHSHKPGYNCVMESGNNFCQVCQAALRSTLEFDLGK